MSLCVPPFATPTSSFYLDHSLQEISCSSSRSSRLHLAVTRISCCIYFAPLSAYSSRARRFFSFTRRPVFFFRYTKPRSKIKSFYMYISKRLASITFVFSSLSIYLRMGDFATGLCLQLMDVSTILSTKKCSENINICHFHRKALIIQPTRVSA